MGKSSEAVIFKFPFPLLEDCVKLNKEKNEKLRVPGSVRYKEER